VGSTSALAAETLSPAEVKTAVVAETQDGVIACPFLTQAKYPFLQCKKDAFGHPIFDAPPQDLTGLRIPIMDSFVQGAGYWGS
jgi:hypothetical protein